MREYITVILEEMVKNIDKLPSFEKTMLNSSMEVNSLIKCVKIGKGVKHSILNCLPFTYTPLLSAKSQYLKKKLGFDIFYILKSITKNYSNDEELMKYATNEIFNLLNYKKTTVNVLSSENYKIIVGILSPISKIYCDTFRCNTSKYFLENDIDFNIVSSNIEFLNSYKILYVKPKKSFTDTNIENIDTKVFAMPVIIGKNGIAINKALWNICYDLNSKFNANLVVRCLVPENVKVLEGMVMDTNLFINKEILSGRYYCYNFSKIPKEHFNKLSIFILSTIDTILNKQIKVT